MTVFPTADKSIVVIEIGPPPLTSKEPVAPFVKLPVPRKSSEMYTEPLFVIEFDIDTSAKLTVEPPEIKPPTAVNV